MSYHLTITDGDVVSIPYRFDSHAAAARYADSYRRECPDAKIEIEVRDE